MCEKYAVDIAESADNEDSIGVKVGGSVGGVLFICICIIAVLVIMR